MRHAYIGCRTDEELCPEGIAELSDARYPEAERVYASPMKRCIETAKILYPDKELEIVKDFRECDFGEFEGLTYADLNGREDYQRWIDSGGEAPFPGGERRAEFAERCVKAYKRMLEENHEADCAIVAHGGTIMAIMEEYARPKGSYFDFQVKNGEGYILMEDGLYKTLKQ